MEKVLKECSVCKNMFEPCTSCDSLSIFYKDTRYQWRKVVCCGDHFYAHIILIEYRDGKIDKKTAKQRLEEALDRYGKIDFNDNVKSLVDEILSEEIIDKISKVNKVKLNK